MLSNIWEKVTSTVRAGIDWVADTWAVRSIAGAAREVLGGVVDLIGEPVANLIAGLADALDAVFHLILTPIRKAWDFLAPRFVDFFRGLDDFFSAVYDGFLKVVRVWIPNLISWVGRAIGAAKDFVLGVIDGVRRWAVDRVADLWEGLQGLRRWVTDNVFAPLWNLVRGLTTWAAEKVAWLWELIDGLRRWVVDNVLTPLWEGLNAVTRFIVDRVVNVVRLVEAAWSVFQAILRYGPAGLLALLLPGRSGRLFGQIVDTAQGDAVRTVGALDDAADVWLRL